MRPFGPGANTLDEANGSGDMVLASSSRFEFGLEVTEMGFDGSPRFLANSIQRWIDPREARISVARQCELLGLPRSTYYDI